MTKTLNLEKVSVSAWSPAIHVSEGAPAHDSLQEFIAMAPLAFEAPEIVFSELGATAVTGGLFTMKSGKHGVVEDSFYLMPGRTWEQTVRPGAKPKKLAAQGEQKPFLVIGNVASHNYYHWNFQSLISLLLFRKLSAGTSFITIMPPLNRWQRETLSLVNFEGECIEASPDDILVVPDVVRSNVTGGIFAFAPHVTMTAEFEDLAKTVKASSPYGRKIYVSRLDAGSTRRILNEEHVCNLMASYGFDVVVPGKLSVTEQICTFRDADVIVGAHGAGMTNLLFSIGANGPRIVELFQSNYVNACYTKMCQAKGLDYTAVVSPGGLPVDKNTGETLPVRNVNDSVCIADLKLIESVISKL